MRKKRNGRKIGRKKTGKKRKNGKKKRNGNKILGKIPILLLLSFS